MVTRDSVFATKLKQETIPVPEWNGTVVVKALSSTEYLAMVNRIKGDSTKAVGELIVAATFNEDGKRIFLDEDAATLEQQQPFSVIELLISKILELNPNKEVASGN